MMRKFNKKKGRRQGAILVTVVFILAFAIIFIAAAMSLTQYRRRGVYKEAKSNQARLTVTSVAEAFYRAVQKCEFLDEDLIDMCKGNKTIRIQASSNAGHIPGLEDIGTATPSTVSFTTCTFKRVHKAGAGTSDDDYTYYADFSTHIDGQVENVRAELSYVTPPHDIDSAPFTTQVDINNKFTQNNMELVGEGKEGDLDNIFLVRKGSNNKNSSFSSTATLIYCDGDVVFKDEDFKSTDIVFLQGARLATGDSGKFKTGHVKNLFFFGSGTEPISNESSRGNFGDCVKSDTTFYLCGRTNVSAWTSGGNVVEINADGTKKSGGAVFSNATTNAEFVNKVKAYAQYNAKYKAGGTNPFPTTDEFLTSSSSISHNKVSTKTAPNNPTWSGSLGDFLTTKSYQKNGGAYVPSGIYVFTEDGSNHDEQHPGLSAKEPYVVVLKGGEKYQFWFKSDKQFDLFNVIFIVNDPSPSYPVMFMLENKAKVYWPGTSGSSNCRVCGNGILAVQSRSFTDAAATYNFVKTEWGKDHSQPKDFEKGSKGYSTRYNGTNEPCAMVIGMGNNTFSLDKNILMEAFIGLFNDSYGSSAKSHFTFRNNDGGVFYGRVMTDGYDDSDSGSMVNPASPSASALPSPNPPIKKVVTGFSLNSMKYYYGITPV